MIELQSWIIQKNVQWIRLYIVGWTYGVIVIIIRSGLGKLRSIPEWGCLDFPLH